MSADIDKQWENFLNPDLFKQRLLQLSVFITAYESLKQQSLIEQIKSYYFEGFENGKILTSKKYETDVLALDKSPMKASALWLRKMDALGDDDLILLDGLRLYRNEVAHQIESFAFAQKEFSPELLRCVFALVAKIDQWFIRELHIQIDPVLSQRDFTEQELSEVKSMRMMMMSLMIQVAEGDDLSLRQVHEWWKAHLEKKAAS